MKQIFISILFCLLGFAFADTTFRFRLTDDGSGIYIDKYTGTDTVVYIQPYYNDLPVKGIGRNAFSGTNVAEVVEVHLPETIEWIGFGAFSKSPFIKDNKFSKQFANSLDCGVL